MTLGRTKCVIKGVTRQKVMPHGEFMDRIRKSLYFGGDTVCDDMEVSRPLAEYASELFSEPHKGHSLNRLTKVTAGSVHATPCSLIMALIYLDRLNATDPSYVRRITPSELFIVSMMISTKFYTGYDEEIYISDWAEDGNMTEERLKQLELEFLCSIDWKIYISNEQFFAKLTSIEKTLARREGLRRGWLTYTELIQMLPSFTLAKFLFSNFAVMAVSYAAGVMTIAGAFFLASQIPGNALHRIRRTSAAVGDVRNQVREACTKGVQSVDSTGVGDVMPSPTDLLNVNERTTAAINSQNKNTTATSPAVTNSTCCAFNVEEELSKLERQYRYEQYMDEIRMRNNENNGPLYDLNAIELNPRYRGLHRDTDIHWYSYKDEYSDPISNSWNTGFSDNMNNCTTTLLWNLLSKAENPFFRVPFIWFKFM